MDQQQQHPPMNGDDELAKALDGGLQFEETPVAGEEDKMPTFAPSEPVDDLAPAAIGGAPTLSQTPPVNEPSAASDDASLANRANEPAPAVQHTHTGKNHSTKDDDKKQDTKANPALEKLKASALEELRPLVGKLDLPAEEKFDTLLLIIRSTDDQSLLDAAHAAAKDISDETRRAQALLDVIKEIDYFSSKR